MQARSSRYDEAAFNSRTANARVTVRGKDREVLAILPIVGSEGINVDSTASSTRTFTVDVAGSDHIPDSLDDLLAPGVHRLHVETGLRLDDTAILTQQCGPGHGWAVTDQSLGQMNGLVEDADTGWLTMAGDTGVYPGSLQYPSEDLFPGG